MADPIYRQIAESLRLKIESGEIAPGEQLRTEAELREHYDASRNTIRDAIKWLISLGLVETRPGQGTFVVKKVDPFITTLSADTGTGLGGGEGATYLSQVTQQDREASSTVPQVEMQTATGEVAVGLQLEDGALVISRHQKRYIDETPWSLQTSYYPRGLAVQGADRLFEPTDIPEGTVQYLGETLGLKQVGYRDWISVRTPNETEVEFFKLPQDGRVGVFEVFRTAFDQTGTPMRLTLTIFPTDRNQFIVNDGQVPPLQPRRSASTKKSLANPLQAGQATFAPLVSVVTARSRKDHKLEPTKSPALCSRITGRVSRFLPWSSSVATAEEGARWAHFAARRRQSFPHSPSPGSSHDDSQPYLDAWQTADETVTAPMLIAKATVADLPVVLSLVNEASEWLRAKETDQWATPWPSEEERNNRILTGLRNEKTWIVWDGDIAAATVTIATRANTKVWQKPACKCDLSEKAVYVHRLITARKYAGSGLGAELIDWAGLRGRRKHRAKWIRVDVWTSNKNLHKYYMDTGFEPCGECSDPAYPSGALFQKPISVISKPINPLFTELSPVVKPADDRELVGAG